MLMSSLPLTSRHAQRCFITLSPPPYLLPIGYRLLSKSADGDIPPPPPPIKHVDTPQDKLAARSWIAELKKHPIPKRFVEFTFSRSSGPGGQNVNKVNTKASLRCNVNSPWVPAWARTELRRTVCTHLKHTYYVSSTDEILITSSVHRSQAQNVETCLSQLRTVLVAAALNSIKNDPTKEQVEKVKGLQRAAQRARRRDKTHRSEVKQSRRTRDWD